jgi:hypothetical protein
MSSWFDRVTRGPARRRRRIEREFRALDRRLARSPLGGRPRRRRVDVRTALTFAITVVALAGVVVAEPSVLPASVRHVIGLGPKRLVAAPAATGSGSFAFMASQPGDPSEPVTYDPCRPIDVRVNPAGAPSGGVDLVRAAMADVGRAAGLELRYVGTTKERPSWQTSFVPTFLGRVRTRPVLVTWATAAEVPQLEGNVAGIGGSVPVPGPDGVTWYATGGITLDMDSFAAMETMPNGRALMRAVVLHEFGHVVGLAHVHDAGELMNGDNVGLLDYGPGDLRGLAEVGSGRCA